MLSYLQENLRTDAYCVWVRMLGSGRREKGVMRGKRIARRSESKQDDIRHLLTYKPDGVEAKENSKKSVKHGLEDAALLL
jgi:hypothetical protein